MRSNVRSAVFAAILLMSSAAFGQNVDMTASISDSPDPVTTGVDTIVYTATLTNNTAGVSAAGPTLTVTIPAASTIGAMSANNGGSCTSSGPPTITCTWAAFSGFGQRQATITITPTGSGTYNATAYASATNETNTANNSATTTTTVNSTIDLAVYSTGDNPNDITLGHGNVTYSIYTYNYSSSKATNPVLTVALPASSTYVSHTVDNSGTCTPSGSTLTCTWPVQNSGGYFTTTVTVTPNVGGTNTLTASIAADQVDHLPSNNSRSENTNVNATIDLAVYSTGDNPNDITLGQGNVTYSIYTYNYSTSKATNPVLSVALPASSTYVSHTVDNGGTCTPSGSTLACTWPVQNPGGNFTTTVTVTPGVGGTNSLTASLAADQGDHVPSNNSRTENTTVNATIDLAVYSTSDNPNDITLGHGNVIYTVTTYNYSSSKATNPVLTVTLPTSSTYVSHTVDNGGTCSPSGGVLTCNWPVQSSGGWFTTTVTVTPGVGGTNSLTASLAADQGDHVPSNNSRTENTTVNATIDLTVYSTGDNPNDITLGQGNVTYTIITYNYSTSKATNPVLTLNLPGSSTYVSHTADNGGTCSQSGSVVTCNWPVQNSGGWFTTTVTVTPGVGGTNTLSAAIAADQGDHVPANNSRSENTTVNATIDLAVYSTSDNPNDITLGQGNVKYTVTTYNYSSSKATNPVLTVNLPASSTYVSHTADNGGTCSQSGGVLTCNWAVQNSGGWFTATVTVTPGVGGTNTLSAAIAADQGDHVPSNNSRSENTTVNATIDLTVYSTSDNPNDITLGQGNVIYSIFTYNFSSSKATNPVLTVTLPTSSTYVSHTTDNGGTCSQSGGVLTCNWPVQNSGGWFTTTVTVTPGAGGTNTLTANVAADQGDHVPSNNSRSENTTVNATIDLAVYSTSDNPNDITLGQGNVIYSIFTYNYSSSKATNPVLTVTLPTSSTYVSHTTDNGGTCSQSGGVLTCNWAVQNSGGFFTTTVTVTPGAGGTNTLSAGIAATQGDHVGSNNSRSETTTVNATLDLQLSLTDSPDPRTVGTGVVTYSMQTYNATSSKATNPVFTLTLPGTVTYNSATPSTGGTCSESGGVVTCTWPDIGGFSLRTASIVVTPTAAGQISATGNIAATQGDPNTANNTIAATTNINPGSAPTIASFTPASGPAGTTVTITGSNFFSSTSVKFNGVFSSFTVNGNGSITAIVPAGATSGPITITNSVGPTTSGSSFVVTPKPDLTVSKTASAASVPTGSPVTYTITVNNAGTGATHDVTVVDTLPAGVSVTSGEGSDSNWTCSGTATVTCILNAGALAGSSTAPAITIDVTAPASGTTITNTAVASTTTPEISTANNSSSVSVSVVGCPSTPAITAPVTVCKNSTGHSANTPVVPSATNYVWTVTNGTITGGQGTNAVTFDAGASGPISVAVDVFVTSCPTAGNSVNVNVSAPAATISASGPTTFCTGQSVTLTANNGQSWLWSTGGTSQSIVVNTNESVTVQVTDTAGCTATSSPTAVTVHPAAVTPNISATGPTTFCAGGSVTLVSSESTGNQWKLDGSPIPGANGQNFVATSAGSYTVVHADGNGCSAESAATTVVVNSTPPPPVITADGPLTFCDGDDVVLTAPASTGYLWSNGATTQSITVTASGTFSVQVDGGSGCLSAPSSSVTVSVNPRPATPTVTAAGPTTFCAGGSVVLTASNADAWLWSNGATTQSITVNASGTFSVQAVNASNCASPASTPVTVNVDPLPPTPSITADGPTSFCAGGSVTLSAPAASGYLWSNGATSQSITVGAAGTFTVQVTGANGCQSASSAPVSVAVNPTPVATVTANGPTSFCTGGSVMLTASNADAWLWSDGSVTQSITVSTSGSYSVQVTTAGCSSQSAPVTVTVNPPPAVNIAGPVASCANEAVVLDAGPGASWSWNTGDTSRQITVSPAATTSYSVTVTNANGCSASDTHTITVSSNPVATINTSANVCAASTGNAASVASQTGATYAWTIANGTITSAVNTSSIAFTAGSSGQVTLGVTVTKGSCVSTGSVQVPVAADPSVAISGPASICPNSALTLSVPIGFSSYLWSTGAHGPSITVNQTEATKTYSVTVTSAAGCTATAHHTVTLVSEPNAGITAPASAPPFSTQTASVPAQPGATFLWSIFNGTITDGQGTSSIEFTTGSTGETTLGVDVTLSGCSASSGTSITIEAPEPPPCPTQPAALTAPNNGATVDPQVILQWTPVSGATSYDVFVNGTPAGTTNLTSLPLVLPAGTFTWYVVVHFDGDCAPLPSAIRTFIVQRSDSSDPCAVRASASPLSPANFATVSSSAVELRWSPAFGATGYRIWASIDGADFAVLGSTGDTSLRTTIERGLVIWYAEALYAGCPSTESERFRFTIPAAQNCGTNRPALVSPANDAVVTSGSVTFQWGSVAGAIGYEVYLALENGTPALIGSTSGESLTHAVPPGRLQWFVRVLVDRCPSRDSQISSFTFAEPQTCEPAQRPVPVAPLDDVRSTSPVSFSWSASAGATKYELFIVRGNSAPQLVATTAVPQALDVALQPGKLTWFVRTSVGQGCASLDSSSQALEIVPAPAACTPLPAPVVSAPGQISAGAALLVQWPPVVGATAYQLQLADDAGFADAQTIDTNATQHPLTPTNESSGVRAIYARVRALDGRCTTPSVSAFSPPAAIFVLPRITNEGSASLSDPTPLTFNFVLGPEYAGQSFAAAPKQPWLTVTPASGVIGAAGTTLAVTADTKGLPVGTSLGAISVTLTSAAGGIATNGTSTVNTSFSVSLVTPVTYDPKSTPPPDALIIPAVAHADGINSRFQSDVRVSNTSAQLIKYQLTFTPSGESGLAQGQQSTFSIEPGATIALDDILRTWFGTGTGGAMGTLEVRPLTETQTATSGLSGLASLVTFASSRTFNVTANGTYGQYIPAIPFANFIGRERILSLQQVAQSTKYRTNLGLLEASGNPVSLTVRVFGEAGQYLTDFPVGLKGGQHLQLNAFLRDQGIADLNDGRVEVEVVSGDGRVTAYASVLDNDTNDPLLVTPVTMDSVGATKWVVPGVADLVSGFATWQTDTRLFNAGTEPVEATLSFYAQGSVEPKVKTLTIGAGQVQQFDRTLASLFGVANEAGALHITTAGPAKLIATARTYNQTSTGTYGQFISAVTPAEAAGTDSRPLQLLQVEETDRFRSNVGFVEVTGKPVRLEISVVPPDAKFTALTELELAPNEFRQLNSLLRGMGLPDTYNARVTVRVVEGEGRVTAYASVIDMQTNDPTYVPAQ